jgi:hypothetical protein
MLFLNILLQKMNRGMVGASNIRFYDSTQGFSDKAQLIITLIIIAIGLYVGLRVWISLKKDKMNRK